MHFCPTCDRSFSSFDGLQKHKRAKEHCYCSSCDRFFVHSGALNQHLTDSPVHATHFSCCNCDRDFVTEQALNQHLRDKIHYHQPRFPAASLLTSTTFGNVICPGGNGCKKRFDSPSAAIQHLESGACRSGINRKKISEFVYRTDEERLITSASGPATVQAPTGFIEEDTEFDSDSEEQLILTPSTTNSSYYYSASEESQPSTQALISTASWSLKKCPQCSKSFRNQEDLRKHIESPVHLPKMFHCALLPDALPLSGLRSFSTLSGLVQHLESGACENGKEALEEGMAYIEKKLWEVRRALMSA